MAATTHYEESPKFELSSRALKTLSIACFTMAALASVYLLMLLNAGT